MIRSFIRSYPKIMIVLSIILGVLNYNVLSVVLLCLCMILNSICLMIYIKETAEYKEKYIDTLAELALTRLDVNRLREILDKSGISYDGNNSINN